MDSSIVAPRIVGGDIPKIVCIHESLTRRLRLSFLYYLESIGNEESREKTTKRREKILTLLSEDGKLSAAALAKKIGISAKSVKNTLPTSKPMAS